MMCCELSCTGVFRVCEMPTAHHSPLTSHLLSLISFLIPVLLAFERSVYIDANVFSLFFSEFCEFNSKLF